ncbi:MAG: NADH-quinone oxidoreductase subunit N [Pseudobdellovibrionaceae bacterium]
MSSTATILTNFKFDVSDLLPATSMIILFIFSLLPITIKVLRGNREQAPIATVSQGLIGVFASAFCLVLFSGYGRLAFSDSLVFDGMTTMVGLIALGSVAISILLMYENQATRGAQFSELIFLAMSSALGMLILVSALDLLTIFIGLELMSLSLYLMIGMSHEEKLSKESALKYFVLGSFASAIFLYGVSFIYGMTGTTNIGQILGSAVTMMETNRLFLFGVVLVVVGFCFKVSIVPFHAWTPDVYQGAPTPLAAMMATAVKAVSFAAFIRVITTKSLMGSEGLFDLLQWLAVITMIVGNVAAVIQNNFKRMLAYSSIANSGYILVGVIATGISGENNAFSAGTVIFYLMSYSIMTLGCFALISMMEKEEQSIVSIEDLSGMAKKHPLIALSLTVLLLSLAGIPPTLGFFSKFYLFNAAIGEGLLWLAIWGVLSSVISVFYYLRPIVMMYMKDGEFSLADHKLNATTATVFGSAILIFVLGVLSGPIMTAVEQSLIVK